jgi:hypothetical protein
LTDLRKREDGSERGVDGSGEDRQGRQARGIYDRHWQGRHYYVGQDATTTTRITTTTRQVMMSEI